MEKEKLLNELKEIKEVKLPILIEIVKQSAKLGDLADNYIYNYAINEQSNLYNRINEIEDILNRCNIKEDYKKLKNDMIFYDTEEKLDAYLKRVKEFYKKYHNGDVYQIEEVSLLYYLTLYEKVYVDSEAIENDNYADKIFNLQTEILSLTKKDDNQQILKLYNYWDCLFDLKDSENNNIFDSDLYDISYIEKLIIFKPLLNLMYVTGIYFINKKEKTFTYNELHLINYVSSLFLDTKRAKNAYYYVLEALLESISNGKLNNELRTINAYIEKYCFSYKIEFSTIKALERDIYELQFKLWEINLKLNESIDEDLEVSKK